MEVILAECAGACYGVQRALNLALEQAECAQSTQTLGPLIHNPQVVAALAEKGVTVASYPDQIDAECVVIRSHGVTPETLRQVENTGAKVINATCPHVIRAQKAAESLAKQCATVLVLGEKSHPEVCGITAYAREAGGNVVVAQSVDEIPAHLDEPVGIVVQTTQSHERLDQVVDYLNQQGVSFVVKDTICTATSRRQESAANLAADVDAMVVIGGHNSSNTTRLYEICAKNAPQAFHIERPEELQKSDFSSCARVGVTAGASTPQEQIQAVISLLVSWE